jgi:hypothetical protein
MHKSPSIAMGFLLSGGGTIGNSRVGSSAGSVWVESLDDSEATIAGIGER